MRQSALRRTPSGNSQILQPLRVVDVKRVKSHVMILNSHYKSEVIDRGGLASLLSLGLLHNAVKHVEDEAVKKAV